MEELKKEIIALEFNLYSKSNAKLTNKNDNTLLVNPLTIIKDYYNYFNDKDFNLITKLLINI